MTIDHSVGGVTAPAGTDVEQRPGEQTFLVIGATGDLAGRLLLPGLGGLLAHTGADGMHLLGSGVEDWDDARWRERLHTAFASAEAGTKDDGAADAAASSGPLADVVASARSVRADVTAEQDVRHLLQECRGQVVIYFALPPAITAQTCELLARIGVPPGTRLVLEKPFGHDENSARDLNQVLTRIVPEDHVHRVDHFLAKSTVLNILGLRFANRIFEPILNADHIASVDIVFDEDLGLEGRARYYDGAGALADMIQSHLLQVLALLAMDAPPTLDEREVRDRKAQLLRATRIWDDDPVGSSRRARYTAGRIDDRDLPGYTQEPGIDPARMTETLAEVVFAVDTWRWAGVPFRVRSGKALGDRRKEAVITFRPPPRVPTGLRGVERPDRIRIAFGPDALHLDLNVNGPDDPFELDPVSLDAQFGPGELPPYGEVLRGVLDGDPLLSVRGDTAQECWRIVQPVVDAWRGGQVPLQEYPAGSTGPADSLLPTDR